MPLADVDAQLPLLGSKGIRLTGNMPDPYPLPNEWKDVMEVAYLLSLGWGMRLESSRTKAKAECIPAIKRPPSMKRMSDGPSLAGILTYDTANSTNSGGCLREGMLFH
jgi:hypothetical protein